ncbi:MAG: membrane protein of unknown function [Promethearchaeota archaeon]|nr:MAG: membrane protein of unknown function [Candidatus Lokiarchaeota archaeon]
MKIKIEQSICSNCGEKMENLDQKVCKYCGAKLKIERKIAHSPSAALEQPRKNKYSKLCFTFGLISFLIIVGSAIVALAFILSIRASLYSSFGMIDYNSILFPSWGVIPSNKSHEYLRIIGTTIIVLGIIGLIMGIISLFLRKKALADENTNILNKLGSIFGILGILITCFSIIEGFILYRAMPFIVAIT